jgi:hypothetical protein
MQLPIFDEADAIPLADEAPTGDYRTERNLARAAEFLVAYDISRRGWDCFTVGESLRYDLIADVRGLRRIQVKMNRRATYRAPGSKVLSYTFGKNDNKPLSAYAGDVDLLALVGMDRATVLYVLPSQVRVAALHLTAATMTPEMSDLSWASILRSWGIAD